MSGVQKLLLLDGRDNLHSVNVKIKICKILSKARKYKKPLSKDIENRIRNTFVYYNCILNRYFENGLLCRWQRRIFYFYKKKIT